MKKGLAALVLPAALLLLGQSAGRASQADEVFEITQRYFAALLRSDYASMAHVSSDALLKRVGGEARLVELYRSAYGTASERLLRRETVTRITWFDSGVSKVYIVETEREYDSYPAAISIPSAYAVSTADDGVLRLLDLSCLSVDWLDELAPGFRGSDLARDLVSRGVVHPAN